MIPERKLIYEMEVEILKNIISTERLKCVFRIKQVIEGKMFYDYVTVSLPNENEEKQVTYKFLNNTKIESKRKKSTQIFVESIENYCNYGSCYQLFIIMGMYCNINKFSPWRGGSYIDLPQYYKDKKCIINVQNKDNRCFLYSIECAPNYEKIQRHHYMSSHYNNGVDEKEKLFIEHNIEIPVKVNDRVYKKIEK